MRICVFGAGVIGSLYAGKLALAGHEVTVAARGDRLATVARDGIVLEDEASGERLVARVEATPGLDPARSWDVVIVALRKDQLQAALPELSANRVTPRFVSMINSADGSRALAEAVGPARLSLGFPGAGGTRKPDGTVLYRIVSGAIQKTTFGELKGPPGAAVRELAAAVRSAGFPAALSGRMDAWQKTHVAMVSPLANAVYASSGDLEALSRDRGLVSLTIDAIRDGMAVLRSLGIEPEPRRLELAFSMPRSLLTPALSAAFRTRWADTVIARHALSARDEMCMLADEFLALADGSSVEAGALRRLYELAAGFKAR
jgi:2-dehydropantoate 2-reductase